MSILMVMTRNHPKVIKPLGHPGILYVDGDGHNDRRFHDADDAAADAFDTIYESRQAGPTASTRATSPTLTSR